jgi:steroid 5-alpha reductase family enzyme
MLLTLLLSTLAAVVVVMAVSFVIGTATGKYSVIDVIWGPGFVVIAWVAYFLTLGHGALLPRLFLLVTVTIWGLRLGSYILLRNHGLPEDPRYTEMLKDSGRAAIIGKVQVPQGLSMWFVSLPVQVGMILPGPNGMTITFVVIGAVIWVIGFVFEAVGDGQLQRFKADPANKGKLMDRGLWRYSRHPNYFGDAAQWWGFWLMTCWSWGAVTVLSPLLMTYLLAFKTGKVLTEKRMSSSKPGWDVYVRRTSGFFPLPPRRVTA